MTNYKVDALTINLNTALKNPDDIELMIHKLNPRITFDTCKTINNNFSSNKVLLVDDVNVGFINFCKRQNSHITQIVMQNKALYLSQDLCTVLFKCLETHDLDISISYLEIAMDMDTRTVFKKFKAKANANDIHHPRENYILDWGVYYDQVKVKNFDRTYYFINKKNGKKKPFVRLENKSQEIEANGYKKQYILDYLKKNGLDVTKPIIRLETIYPRSNSFRSSTNKVYIDKTNESKYISKYELKKSHGLIKEMDEKNNPFVYMDSKYLKAKNDVDDYVIEGSAYKELEIDLMMLFDEEYLIAIFNKQLPKIIDNVWDFVPMLYTKHTIKDVKKIKRINKKIRDKTIKTLPNISDEDRIIYALKSMEGMSEQEAREVMEKAIDLYKNRELNKVDLFHSLS